MAGGCMSPPPSPPPILLPQSAPSHLNCIYVYVYTPQLTSLNMYGEIYDAHLLLPDNEAFTPGDMPPVRQNIFLQSKIVTFTNALPKSYKRSFLNYFHNCNITKHVPPPEPLIYDRNTEQAKVIM